MKCDPNKDIKIDKYMFIGKFYELICMVTYKSTSSIDKINHFIIFN